MRSRRGSEDGRAEKECKIPNVPGETQKIPLDGVSYFPKLPSVDLNENQRDLNSYAVISYEGFFFSSRRRHTRCGRDWSSDVCSSDLPIDQITEIDRADEEFEAFLLELLSDW